MAKNMNGYLTRPSNNISESVRTVYRAIPLIISLFPSGLSHLIAPLAAITSEYNQIGNSIYRPRALRTGS